MSAGSATRPGEGEERRDAAQPRDEAERLKQDVAALQKQQEALIRQHEEALDALRQVRDREVVAAELRLQAILHGAHNPDDVLRLMEMSEIVREEDGTVRGAKEAMEKTRLERPYLFSESKRPGVATGTTASRAAPRPGKTEPLNARQLSTVEYRAKKSQFLGKL